MWGMRDVCTACMSVMCVTCMRETDGGVRVCKACEGEREREREREKERDRGICV